mgnify:CR=1 FL=1
MNSNLLSIGEFSKIANVHIKSLRYYDKLGVLKPIYVDPKTFKLKPLEKFVARILKIFSPIM